MEACPNCHKKLAGLEKFRGKRVRCPACKGVIAVPAADPLPEPDPIPAQVRRTWSPPPAPPSRGLAAFGIPIGTLVVVGLVVFGAWKGFSKSGEDKEALKFNDDLVIKTDRLSTTADELGVQMDGVIAGGESEIMRQTYDRLVADHQAIVNTLQSMRVPDVEAADVLHRAFLDYMEEERVLINGPILEMVNTADDPELDSDARAARIQELAAALDAEETRSLNKLHAAQAAFGKKHGFIIQ